MPVCLFRFVLMLPGASSGDAHAERTQISGSPGFNEMETIPSSAYRVAVSFDTETFACRDNAVIRSSYFDERRDIQIYFGNTA